MAVVQLNKTRLVTNLSTPKNRSLNDVLKAGKIPKKFYDDSKNWRLHGFQNFFWLITTTNLGSKLKAAPAHFDCIGLY